MSDSRPKRVVVVNDTQEILDLFNTVLGEEMGFDVVLMSYAPDDLRQLMQHEPDLIIIDFVIGGREYEGWQLIQKLRMNRETQAIPVLACTAGTTLIRETEGYLTEQGIDVLMKPFMLDQLERAVRHALRLQPVPGSGGSRLLHRGQESTTTADGPKRGETD